MNAFYRSACAGVALLWLLSCTPADNAAEQAIDNTQIDTTRLIETQADSPATAAPDSALMPVVRDSATAAMRPPTRQRPPIIGKDSVIQPALVPNSEGRLVPRDTL